MPGFGYGRSGAVKRMLGRSQGEKERFPRPQAPQPRPAMPARPQPPTLPPQASERAFEAVAKAPPTLPPGQMLAQGIPLDREAVRQQEMERALQAKQRAANPELQALFQSLRSRMV